MSACKRMRAGLGEPRCWVVDVTKHAAAGDDPSDATVNNANATKIAGMAVNSEWLAAYCHASCDILLWSFHKVVSEQCISAEMRERIDTEHVGAAEAIKTIEEEEGDSLNTPP